MILRRNYLLFLSLIGFTASCLVADRAFAQRTADAPANATKLVVASPLSDHMVLQRDMQAPVWGWAPPGTEVDVTFGGRTLRAAADETGRWETTIGPLDASAEGRTMRIAAGDESHEFDDILVGEVWIASGQSNMEWRVEHANDPDKEIAAADWPQIRLLDIPHRVANEPQQTVDNPGWKVCSPETIRSFSAVAYYFGRQLHDDLDVPVGLISVNWGGTMMEAWTSRDALAESETFAPVIDELTPWDELDERQRQSPHRASVLFNGMLAPVIPYGIRGAIWYQGESNAGRHQQYRELSEVMITDWRRRWRQGEFPFVLVQLAAWEPGGDNWPYLREAQQQTLHLPKTGMAVTTDIGDRSDIHPRNKQEVGRRLELAALAIAYGKDVEYRGPVYRDMEIGDGQVTVCFDHADRMQYDGDELKGFQLAGDDGKFHDASAEIEGDKVMLTSDAVSEPMAVRYNWASYPEGTLRNESGLPAAPFRTDSW